MPLFPPTLVTAGSDSKQELVQEAPSPTMVGLLQLDLGTCSCKQGYPLAVCPAIVLPCFLPGHVATGQCTSNYMPLEELL